MNIIVRPYGSDLCYCRPDTTWERENADFFSPAFVDTLYYSPVVIAKISKAGKYIRGKFAERYFESVNFGMLMYTEEPVADKLAVASCVDHTSILPFPLYNRIVLDNEGNDFELYRNGKLIYSFRAMDAESRKGIMTSLIEDSICKVSERVSLRIGDFVATELAVPAPLTSRQENSSFEDKDAKTYIQATFCGNELFDFNIIF